MSETRFSNDTFVPGSPVLSRSPASEEMANESMNENALEFNRRLTDWNSSERPVLVAVIGVLVLVLRVSAPKPRSEKRVMSLAGGSLVIDGVNRSSVPVSVTVTSIGPDSISEMPPLTRASRAMSK